MSKRDRQVQDAVLILLVCAALGLAVLGGYQLCKHLPRCEQNGTTIGHVEDCEEIYP